MEHITKKNIGIFVGSILILFVILYGVYGLIGAGQRKELKKTNEVILYYGEGCAHCKKVEDFLSLHKEIEKKISIQRKEVYNDKKNSADLGEKALICEQDITKGIPVPFLYFKGKCIIGDVPIIDFLTKQAS